MGTILLLQTAPHFAAHSLAIAADAISLAIWAYLLLARGNFWRVRADDEPRKNFAPSATAPRVVAVIPARNEAAVIGEAVASLLRQEYPGRLELVLVDDHSDDATAEIARQAAADIGRGDRLTIVSARPLPPGWTGKLWALAEGIRRAAAAKPDYFLFTDADIVHAPQNVAQLAARAQTENLDLASLMVKLECRALPERALLPAFLFFFLKLYPPAWTADPARPAAGAAGGCLLIRPAALERIGGLDAIRGELIDDCSLARAMKRGGRIWMGLAARTRSIREYRTFGEIWRMIARTAFTQLHYSPWLLAGALLGMTLAYLAPPLLLFSGNLPAALLGLAAWTLMALAYLPAVRFYRASPLWAPLLPLIAGFYLAATLGSAIRYWTGRGGLWKGRAQAPRETGS